MSGVSSPLPRSSSAADKWINNKGLWRKPPPPHLSGSSPSIYACSIFFPRTFFISRIVGPLRKEGCLPFVTSFGGERGKVFAFLLTEGRVNINRFSRLFAWSFADGRGPCLVWWPLAVCHIFSCFLPSRNGVGGSSSWDFASQHLVVRFVLAISRDLGKM